MALLIRALALVALLGACGLTEPEPLIFAEERIAVHAMLLAGSREASVQVSRIVPAEGGGLPTVTGEVNAEVLLSRGADTTGLLESSAPDRGCADVAAPAGTVPVVGCYGAHLDVPIAPGQLYELHIRTVDGRTVSGGAVVPRPIEILAPVHGSRVGIGMAPHRLMVRWRGRLDAARVEVRILLIDPACVVPGGMEVIGFAAYAGADWVSEAWIDVAPLTRCGQPPPSAVWSLVRMTAFDTAAARYHRDVRRGGWLAERRAGAGLVGAVGLFGGAAESQVSVVLESTSPPSSPAAPSSGH